MDIFISSSTRMPDRDIDLHLARHHADATAWRRAGRRRARADRRATRST